MGTARASRLLPIAMLPGGSLRAFVDVPALLIVLGGTAAVTTISFSLAEIGRTQRVVATALVTGSRKPHQTALELLELADHARRNGTLALEDRLPDLRGDGFLLKAAALAVDASPADTVERMRRTELQATLHRHRAAGDIV